MPGLLPADPALERYRVHPGAVTAVELDPGDVLTVIDADGRQRGRTHRAGRRGRGLRRPRNRSRHRRHRPPLHGRRAPPVIGPLACGGSIPAQARAVALFGEWSPAGTRAEFAARRQPDRRGGGARRADVRGRATTRPRTWCWRSGGSARGGRSSGRLPPPLADPLLDLRVDTATACVLRGQGRPVHPGDRRRGPPVLRLPRVLRPPAGRGNRTRPRRHHDPQPDRERLPAAGTVRRSSSTRTCAPLVEVVRDTVGRHDTFALACNAKYYEDMGYPGHLNCTDNFNGAARAVRHRGPARLAGAQLLLQHLLRRGEPAAVRRALVAAGRLRPAAGHDRPGVRLLGLPR